MEDAGTSGVKLGMVPWSPNLIAAKDPAEQQAGTAMGTGGVRFVGQSTMMQGNLCHEQTCCCFLRLDDEITMRSINQSIN